ncbi:MerR family transcriptional regulator [Piscirickettsia litoralis]|uniref:Helix-turn-helix domain-containing protein n=1 Tax=Piscirickettsia litoralis TaxID=1891921 RepID=A0ABX3A0K5_9GAMM|nr:DNA-binding protein [Piscirickettsia litoralis]ODN40955.1 hypothetical protein BGC07_19015 [Piscirickettsia litoralis]
MKLITVEDYAVLNKMRVQDVYILIQEGKLKTQASEHKQIRLKSHINLVYVEQVPKSIVSLDASIKYLTQKETVKRTGLPVDRVRKMINSGEIKSIRIKGTAFVPADQFETVD